MSTFSSLTEGRCAERSSCRNYGGDAFFTALGLRGRPGDPYGPSQLNVSTKPADVWHSPIVANYLQTPCWVTGRVYTSLPPIVSDTNSRLDGRSRRESQKEQR
jgi:hypothetical protein